jgi:DNA-binding CsgD family transcriptional regulator
MMTKASRPPPRLSPRELTVLVRIAEGDSTDEIVDSLRLAKTTLRDHIRIILAKLNARTRAHAVAIAMREGILK